jgi:hypothetical protein
MASIRDKITTNAQGFLQPGEQVQAGFPAQTKNGYWVPLTGFFGFVFINKYRNVIATDRRILLTDAGRWSTAKSKSVIAEFPRSTSLGDPKGVWWKTEALGQTLYIHKRFHKDVEAANAARTPT